MGVIHIESEELGLAFEPGPRVARADTPDACARLLTSPLPEVVGVVQATALPDPDDVLFSEIPPSGPVPLDFVMRDPRTDFASLYTLARLRDRHPVRVSLEVVDGFESAFTLATALGLNVRIVVGQPTAKQVEALEWALERYLHEPSVVAEVEFFSLVLLHYATSLEGTLWEAEERRRPAGTHAECSECAFEAVCAGYFKRPDPDYACGPVRRLLRRLAAAGLELRRDIASFIPPEGAS